MRVAVVGSGGREHALRFTLARTAEVVDDLAAADLVVIGPERPLSEGLADRLRADGKAVLGPGVDGARLEGSKAWMKELLVGAGIPTARYASFTPDQAASAERFVESLPGPYVIKTDYLAEGKGVLVAATVDEAVADLRAKLDRGSVVVEECMTGPELSLLCVCDGKRAVALSPARDYKRAYDGDVGPMTGGIGAFSPVAGVDGAAIAKHIVQPTLDALRERGIDYRGVLYAGLMLTAEGPKIVEYNVRFGDPESQVIVPRFAGDLAAFLMEAARGELTTEPAFDDNAAVTVVMVSGRYPAKPYDDGAEIAGLADAESLGGVKVFEAGVGRDRDGRPVVAGGRVLNVTAFAPTVPAARDRAYEAASRISWPGARYRRDIAQGEE